MIWNKKKRVEKKWSWGLAATFAVTMVLNGLAGSTAVLGGVNTAQVSDSFPNLFAPAGVTFAIWGVIYLLVAGFILYVFGIGRSKKSTLTIDVLTDVTKLLTVNLALNGMWILAWQYKVLWLSVLLMIALLATLIKIADLLRSQRVSGVEYVQTKLPFSVYFGWITVATVANITTFLVSVNWNGFGIKASSWMVAVLLVAATIGIVTALRNRDAAYLTVFVWAFGGILLKHVSPDGFNGRYPGTIITLSIVLPVLITLCLQLVRERRS